MGGCIGTRNSRPSSGIESTDETNLQQTVSIGKNQPLRHEKPRWKSDVPLMEGQLRSKRDEFWDTAPAFEGRKEIWDALKAAAYAAETSDFTLAQAIIDGANNFNFPTGRCWTATTNSATATSCPCTALSRADQPWSEDASDAESPSPESEPCAGHEIPAQVALVHETGSGHQDGSAHGPDHSHGQSDVSRRSKASTPPASAGSSAANCWPTARASMRPSYKWASWCKWQ
uniref:Putative ubiquitin domain-containing protein n=1 Tax=Ixodes ricinus TaxID=34613 RepID=A0A090X8J2_IXORI